jgi:hypothetical protein
MDEMDYMAEILRLAPLKQHRLAADMTGSRELSPAAGRMVLANLKRCPDRSETQPAGDGPWTTRTGKQLTAAEVSGYAAEAERGYNVKPDSREVSRGPVATERRNPPPMSAFAKMSEGYYATRSMTGNNDLDFWRIDKPSKGRWAGYTFVKRIVGGGTDSEMQSFQLSNIQQRLACQAIMDMGPDESQTLFAAEMTRCIDCGRMLTDKISRDERRGPQCRAKQAARG